MSGKELPKIVDKSPAEIEAAIAAIESSNLQPDIKDFALSCVRLAIWLPDALLSHRITVANLCTLAFGQTGENKRQSKMPKNDKGNPIKDYPSSCDRENAADDKQPVNNEEPKKEERPVMRGHGRLPHSAYKNTIEHKILVPDLKSGCPCPMQCGGNLYSIEPGIIVRVKGQNLASVHKYWVEKIRCALCGYLI